MLLKSTIKRVCEETHEVLVQDSWILYEPCWFSLQQKNTQFCFHVGKKPQTNNQKTNKPTTQQPSTTVMEKSLKQSQVAKKGALTEILASNFTNLSVLKREAPSEADLNQRILLGRPWSPAPIPFVKTRKVCFYKLNTEPWRAAENLTGAWCAGNSCGEKGAHPSAPAVQIPTSSTHKGRERR